MSDTINQLEGNKGQFSSAAGTTAAEVGNGKHQPGKLVGNDRIPEFHAQTLPPGSAPADRTFQPNPDSSTAPPSDSSTAASETLAGASSADVHTGLGHPGAGQSSAELRHDGQSHRKNPGAGGVEGRGAEGVEQSG